MASNLGYVLIEQGDLAGATVLLEEASAIFEAFGMPGEAAMVVLNLGAAEQLRGRLESARQRYEESCDVFQKLGDDAYLAYALTNLGELRFWAGDSVGALDFHRQALKINRELELPSGAAWDTFRIAEVLRRQGELDAAFEHYEDALGEQKSIDEPGVETLIGLARLEIARQNFGDALNHARDATDLLRDAGLCEHEEEQAGEKEGRPVYCPVDLAVLAQLVEAETLLTRPEPDLAGARALLAIAQLHAEESDHRELQLSTRLLASRLAALEGRRDSAAEALERLAEDASANGYLVIAEDARKFLALNLAEP